MPLPFFFPLVFGLSSVSISTYADFCLSICVSSPMNFSALNSKASFSSNTRFLASSVSSALIGVSVSFASLFLALFALLACSIAICYLICLIFEGFISNLRRICSPMTLSGPHMLNFVSRKTSLNSMFWPESHSMRHI